MEDALLETKRIEAASRLMKMGDEFDKKRFPGMHLEVKMASTVVWILSNCSDVYSMVYSNLFDAVNVYIDSAVES